MMIEVLRIGQRLVRDDRVTSHVALVSRALGASRIYMTEVNPDIVDTIQKVNHTWGCSFQVELIQKWRTIMRQKKVDPTCIIIHLTMYGEPINDIQEKIRDDTKKKNVLIIIGAKKVPRDVYDTADYNIAVGAQPHSEIAALAVLLDRLQQGRQFDVSFAGGKRRVVPTPQGKNVCVDNDKKGLIQGKKTKNN